HLEGDGEAVRGLAHRLGRARGADHRGPVGLEPDAGLARALIGGAAQRVGLARRPGLGVHPDRGPQLDRAGGRRESSAAVTPERAAGVSTEPKRRIVDGARGAVRELKEARLPTPPVAGVTARAPGVLGLLAGAERLTAGRAPPERHTQGRPQQPPPRPRPGTGSGRRARGARGSRAQQRAVHGTSITGKRTEAQSIGREVPRLEAPAPAVQRPRQGPDSGPLLRARRGHARSGAPRRPAVPPMPSVRLHAGPFAGLPAELLSIEGDEVLVALTIFGQRRELRIPAADADIEADPGAIVRRLRATLHDDWDSHWLREEQAFWLDRADTFTDEAPPAELLLADHAAWQAALAQRRPHVEAARAAAAARFDAEVATAATPSTALDGLAAALLPEATARAALKARWRADPDAFEADKARSDKAWARRRAAEAEADERAFLAWRAVVDPAAHRPAREDAARRRVQARAAAIVDRVRRDWGLTLPADFFRFLAVWAGLPAVARAAAEGLGFHPMGLSDLLDDPDAQPIDGLDPRLHGRYFRDPPEFLTFLHGGDDGLHYGLWFDTPERCAGVCHTYANDGIALAPPAGSPLGVLHDAAHEALMQGGDAERVWALRVLRDACADDTPAPPTGARWETLDGAGALAPGTPPPPRSHHEAEAHHAALQAEDLSPLTTAALAACAEGDPTPALLLGRDLHWLGRPEAAALLVAAYTALGRPALAGIAAAHHAARELPSVGVLRLPQGQGR
ncbi:MAG: hypothetical protein RL071_4597, partial [Pseudomonadota bacterium]